MKTRIISALLMVALVVPASGCPRTPAVSLGVWLFTLTIGATTNSAGLELGTAGATQEPDPVAPGANTSFGGAATWTQSGSTFTLTHMVRASTFVYTGKVESSTSIVEGTLVQTAGGTGTGTWTAMKL